ncbi:MAG: hypothetical protein H6R26_3320 [Proteobacteria bacterium]|nr:hypothetical protein [Pseudomonadota bacterium]
MPGTPAPGSHPTALTAILCANSTSSVFKDGWEQHRPTFPLFGIRRMPRTSRMGNTHNVDAHQQVLSRLAAGYDCIDDDADGKPSASSSSERQPLRTPCMTQIGATQDRTDISCSAAYRQILPSSRPGTGNSAWNHQEDVEKRFVMLESVHTRIDAGAGACTGTRSPPDVRDTRGAPPASPQKKLEPDRGSPRQNERR